MAASTKKFTFTSSAYQDVSEGATSCSFRLPFHNTRRNVVRVVLDTSLPSAAETNYELFAQPFQGDDSDQANVVEFSGLATTDRVYVRADGADCTLTVFRL